jgi:hypothetical protein
VKYIFDIVSKLMGNGEVAASSVEGSAEGASRSYEPGLSKLTDEELEAYKKLVRKVEKSFNTEETYSRKFSELRGTPFYAVPCKSIQAVLQVIAKSSAESNDLASSKSKRIYGWW